MSIPDPFIGMQLGDYEIQTLLGKGGMARVYRAYDKTLDRYAAIKIIEPQLITTESEDDYRERFLREARSLARLNHPNAVTVYQFGNADESYYIVMAYVEGKDLHTILREGAREHRLLEMNKIILYTEQIASALDYAHSQGIIHRDVKPSNIIVDAKDRAVLTDFGLALNASEGTVGNTFGSVHYIAPEQAISSAQAVPQSDQYSLAIIVYEMLTGRLPFDDKSAMSVALQQISDPPPPLTDINPNVPAAVERVVMRALSKDYRARYESCKTFVNELRLAVDRHLDAGGKFPVVPPPSAVPSTDIDGPTIPGALDTSGEMPMDANLPPSPPKEKSSHRSLMGLFLIVMPVLVLFLFFMIINNDNTQRTFDGTATVVAQLALDQQIAADKTATVQNLEVTITAQSALLALTETTSTSPDLEPTGTELSSKATLTETPVLVIADTESPTETTFPTETPLSTETTFSTETMFSTETTFSAETTNTPTASPTALPTETLTRTPLPTVTATATPGLGRAEEGEDPLLLRYDGRNLILANRAASGNLSVINLRFMLFEPNETGFITNTLTFDWSDWNETRALRAGRCLQLLDIIQYASPPIDNRLDQGLCGGAPFWRAVPEVFWMSTSEEAYFEVRLGRIDKLATCPVVRPGSFTEKRCTLNLP